MSIVEGYRTVQPKDTAITEAQSKYNYDNLEVSTVLID